MSANICICGGGHLGHVVAGFIAAHDSNRVSILTRRPALWGESVRVTDPDGNIFDSKLSLVTDDPAKALAGCDLAILCLPGFSIREELEKIRPHLSPATAVGSVVASTGFFFQAFDTLSPGQPLFAFQRVPFISRTTEYGHAALLLGYKPSLSVAIERCDNKPALLRALQNLFKCPVSLLASHYEASLTNSNPLLHTSRLYSMWKDFRPGTTYPSCPKFYSDWTTDAAQTLIDMDREFMLLLNALGVKKGSIPPILDYYESHDAQSLTAKLRSIPAFSSLLSPMTETEAGFVPDFSSRYFTEDFPFGLRYIHDLIHQKGIPSPVIDKVFAWGMSQINK